MIISSVQLIRAIKKAIIRSGSRMRAQMGTIQTWMRIEIMWMNKIWEKNTLKQKEKLALKFSKKRWGGIKREKLIFAEVTEVDQSRLKRDKNQLENWKTKVQNRTILGRYCNEIRNWVYCLLLIAKVGLVIPPHYCQMIIYHLYIPYLKFLKRANPLFLSNKSLKIKRLRPWKTLLSS